MSALGSGAILGAVTIASGCVAPGDETEDVGVSQEPVVLTNRTFRKVDAGFGSATSTSAKEHCRVPQSLLGNGTFVAGQQLRLSRGGTLSGVCTVDVSGAPSTWYEVHSTAFENRLATTPTEQTAGEITDVTVSNQYASGADPAIANPAASADDAFNLSNNDVREYRRRDATAQVIYTAPHSFERGTFYQARDILNANPARNALWVAGFAGGDFTSVTFDKFHTTSTEISGASFPLLGAQLQSPMPYAVSFHGHGSTCSDDVVVGGAIEPSFRKGTAEIITEYLSAAGLSFKATSQTLDADCDLGSAGNNFVNLLAFGGRGMQLEQSYDVRKDDVPRNAVRDATRSVFDCLLDNPDQAVSSPQGEGIHAESGGTAYTEGSCPRWIAQASLTSSSKFKLWAGIDVATCNASPETRVHSDFYRQRSDGTWERLGGGWMFYKSSGGICSLVDGDGYEFVDSVQGPATIRAVVVGIDQAKARVPVFFDATPSP